jgi:hypothetical protein
MFGVYNEALALVERVSGAASADGQVKGEQQQERLKLLTAYVKDLKLRRMMQRTFLLFTSENVTGQRAVSAEASRRAPLFAAAFLSFFSPRRAVPCPPHPLLLLRTHARTHARTGPPLRHDTLAAL